MNLTLDQALDRKNNNFNLVRLIASTAVIFGHSFSLFHSGGEPFKKVLVNDYSGSLAVYIFFFLSGIFITSSFLNAKNPFSFITMRIFRIWPALIVCILITVFIVGPAFTNLPLSKYLEHRETWKYLVKNMVMFHFEPKLHSVFESNFFKAATNGSLWTLPTEIKCYLMVLILGITGFLKRVSPLVMVFIAFFIFRHDYRMYKLLDLPEHIKFVFFFITGMVCHAFKDKLIINYQILTGFIAISAIFYILFFNRFEFVFYPALLYAVLVLSTSPIALKVKLPGDYSYGIYIYGFLIQQITGAVFPAITAYASMLITIPAAVLIGTLSWYLIESPSLKSGKKIAHKFVKVV